MPSTRGHLLTLAILCGGLAAVRGTGANAADQATDARARAFIAAHVKVIRPLEQQAGLAWWNANVSGEDKDFEAKVAAENRMNEALSNADRFAELKAIRAAGVDDPLLARQIEVLYRSYLEKQVDPELLRRMTEKANEIEKAFNVYRAEVDGKELTDSQVREVLKESKDLDRRRAVWEASKGVGSVVEENLRNLVLLRNEAATKLGFKDYHAMQLYLNEQDQDQVLLVFDELDALTREPFAAIKADIDARLAANYGIAVDELRPWHYHDPFFQEPPAVYGTSLDAVFADVDIPKLCQKFYAGIGLPVDDVIARSDLFEKPGKSPHAFCIDIDREGDVRVLVNIVPNENWASTTLHELGHAVYSKNLPRTLPYTLRIESHILTTEGVAMMFERLSKNADWLTQMGISVPDPQAYNEAGATMRRNQLLIFSRWCQVMLRFEKELYADPSQDLNKLWWDLVEQYQGLTRPEGRDAPDYASKIHVVSAPAYYHNYMMGELFASQVHRTIAREVLNGADPATAVYVGNPAVGRYMRERVFAPGRTLDWNELTKYATGEDLGAAAFAADIAAR